MLILTRRVNEAIMIGDDITLVILGSSRSQIKIGIDAPKDVLILREELYHKAKSEGWDDNQADSADTFL